MKMCLYFLLMVTVDAVNRLQLFNKHHYGRLGQLRNGIINRRRHTKPLNSKRTMTEMIRKEVAKRICNIQTCAKCNKLVGVSPSLANKYCTLVINMPNCCSKDRMLFGKFWNIFVMPFAFTAVLAVSYSTFSYHSGRSDRNNSISPRNTLEKLSALGHILVYLRLLDYSYLSSNHILGVSFFISQRSFFD